jgi:hypothetical protein
VPAAAALNVQSRLSVARQALLERQARLGPRQAAAAARLRGGDGGVVLVEGDPGCGKSTLLAHFFTRATLRPDPLPCAAAGPKTTDAKGSEDDAEDGGGGGGGGRSAPPPFFATAASPFHSRPFGVWCTVLQQWLDFAAAADKRGSKAGRDKSSDLPAYSPSSGRSSGGSVSADHSRREASSAEAGRQARTTLCLELLPPHLRANHAWRLNALVGVDCEAVRLRSRGGGGGNGGGHSSSHSSGGGSGGGAVAEAERGPDVLGVLDALVRALAKRCAAVVVIDDAHALDPESWALAHALATGPPEASDDAAAPDLPPPSPNAPPVGQSYREDNTHAEDGSGGGTTSSSSSGHPPAMPRLLLVLAMRPMAAYGPTFKRTAPDYEALAALSESRPDTVVTARPYYV